MSASDQSVVHTPGPWECEHMHTVICKEWQTLARVYQGEGRTHAESVANAKLIAAAPDMFRIIQRLATADWIGEAELNLWRKDCLEIMRKVSRTIY